MMMEQLSFACMNNTGLGDGKNEHLMWLRFTDLPAMPRPTKHAPDPIKRARGPHLRPVLVQVWWDPRSMEQRIDRM